MAPIRGPAWALCTLGSALLFLSGCDKLTHSETDWARAALARNPDLTIVAADADARTFTVQVKGSNELHVVRVDELIGDVPSSSVASNGDSPASASTATTGAASSEPESEPATASAGEAAAPSGTQGESASAPSATAARGELKKSSTGEVLASIGQKAPDTSAEKSDQNLSAATERGAAAETSAAAAPGAAASNAAAAPGADKRLLASGPGYSITAGEARANRPLRLAEAAELKSPVNVAVERRYEPIICQGNRLVQIDGRNLEFEGDAVAALDGCEIHITNSHIIAHGLGLQARAAHVHIKNSIIEGDAGSLSASEGAKIYSQQSTFKGLSRRLDTATFTDLGGTRWD